MHHNTEGNETHCPLYYYYQPQRSCGQGNIFTPVCHSVHGGGGGVCLSTCWDTTPQEQTSPGADTPPETRYTSLPGLSTPPGKQTPAYGQRPAGTHPTGMYSCFLLVALQRGQKSSSMFTTASDVKSIRTHVITTSLLLGVNLCATLCDLGWSSIPALI